jgi:hypothetical protein
MSDVIISLPTSKLRHVSEFNFVDLAITRIHITKFEIEASW